MALTIRPATLDDAPALAYLNAAFNGETQTPAQIAARLLAVHEIEVAFLAELEGKLAGFACLRIIPCLLYDQPYAELTELYIEPDSQRRGVARALIEHVEQVARERGAADLFILTGLDNTPAQSLYQGQGFASYAVALHRKLSTNA